MGKARTKSEDKRKPKHGLDVNRPSKGEKGSRDAATVRCCWKQALGVLSRRLSAEWWYGISCRSAVSICTRSVLLETQRARSFIRCVSNSLHMPWSCRAVAEAPCMKGKAGSILRDRMNHMDKWWVSSMEE